MVDQVLQRFRDIKFSPAWKKCRFEALEFEDHILIRESKKSAGETQCCTNGCLCMSSILLMILAFCLLPTPASWITAFSCMAGTVWLIERQQPAHLKRRIYFEIAPTSQQISVPAYGAQAALTINTKQVYCFYFWCESDREIDRCYIATEYDNGSRVTFPIDSTIGEQTASLLGFLYERPAFKRDVRGKVTPLSRSQWRPPEATPPTPPVRR
jgi:hypothetical protein